MSVTASHSPIYVTASGGLGDVLMEIPLLRRLKKQYPQRPLVVVGTNRNGGLALLRYEACVDQILELPTLSGRVSVMASMFKKALITPSFGRESEIYVPVYSLDSETFWFLSFMKKLGKLGRVTAQFERDPESSARRLPDYIVAYDPALHDIENHFRLGPWSEPCRLEERTCDSSRLPPLLLDGPLEFLRGKKFWLFQAGAGRGTTNKILKPEGLAFLVTRLSEKYPDITPVLIGGKSEQEGAQEVSRRLRVAHIDLTGQTSMSSLLHLIRGAVGVTSYDSGVMHLAIWLGVPAFSIFGPTDPRRNGPPLDARYSTYREMFEGCFDPCHIPTKTDCPNHLRCVRKPDLALLSEELEIFSRQSQDVARHDSLR